MKRKKYYKIGNQILYSLTFLDITIERYPSPRLYARAQNLKFTAMASRWQSVGDLIDSGFKPHTSRSRNIRLATCAIWSVVFQFLRTHHEE